MSRYYCVYFRRDVLRYRSSTFVHARRPVLQVFLQLVNAFGQDVPQGLPYLLPRFLFILCFPYGFRVSGCSAFTCQWRFFLPGLLPLDKKPGRSSSVIISGASYAPVPAAVPPLCTMHSDTEMPSA